MWWPVQGTGPEVPPLRAHPTADASGALGSADGVCVGYSPFFIPLSAAEQSPPWPTAGSAVGLS
jgi:hypothetical protein